MLRAGSEVFRTLEKINKNPLWANESAASNFYRLMSSGFIERERAKSPQGTFLNKYSITSKGRQELEEIHIRERLRAFEEHFFRF